MTCKVTSITSLRTDINISFFHEINVVLWYLEFCAEISDKNVGDPCPEVASKLSAKNNYENKLSQTNVVFVLYLYCFTYKQKIVEIYFAAKIHRAGLNQWECLSKTFSWCQKITYCFKRGLITRGDKIMTTRILKKRTNSNSINHEHGDLFLIVRI